MTRLWKQHYYLCSPITIYISLWICKYKNEIRGSSFQHWIFHNRNFHLLVRILVTVLVTVLINPTNELLKTFPKYVWRGIGVSSWLPSFALNHIKKLSITDNLKNDFFRPFHKIGRNRKINYYDPKWPSEYHDLKVHPLQFFNLKTSLVANFQIKKS